MSRIVIRADAGTVPEIGTGHILRAIKLADALDKAPVFHGFEILFATREQPPYKLGGQLVKQAGYRILGCSDLEPNSKSELHAILDAEPKIVIFDRLKTEKDLVLELKSHGIVIVTFDDLGSGQPFSDLAIHSILQNIDPKPNVFFGYDFLFLPSDERIECETSPLVSEVFVSFGGFDYRQLSTYFLESIPKISGPARYNIVLSESNNRKLNKLVELSRQIEVLSNVEIRVHQRPASFYNLLRASDLAIVSGGLTALECAYAGIPAIGIPQYEHQLENFQRLEKRGCLKLGALNMKLDRQFLCDLVTSLSKDYTERLAMSQAGMELIDGKGLKRTVNLIAQVFANSQLVPI